MKLIRYVLLGAVTFAMFGDGPPVALDNLVRTAGTTIAAVGNSVPATATDHTREAVGQQVAPDTMPWADAAVLVTMRTDDGAAKQQGRWGGPVTFHVHGADAGTAAAIDGVLTWAAERTGLVFIPADAGAADLTITVEAGTKPRARIWQNGTRIVRADVHFPPGRERVMWEELLQALGPAGDYGPAGNVFTTAQTADRPGPFDEFVLTRLYSAEHLHGKGRESDARTMFLP
jgi:hypothetical protein